MSSLRRRIHASPKAASRPQCYRSGGGTRPCTVHFSSDLQSPTGPLSHFDASRMSTPRRKAVRPRWIDLRRELLSLLYRRTNGWGTSVRAWVFSPWGPSSGSRSKRVLEFEPFTSSARRETRLLQPLQRSARLCPTNERATHVRACGFVCLCSRYSFTVEAGPCGPPLRSALEWASLFQFKDAAVSAENGLVLDQFSGLAPLSPLENSNMCVSGSL